MEALQAKLSSEEHKFAIYPVQCLNRGPHADEFYQELADKTGTQRIQLDDFQSMIEIFMGLCYRAHTDREFAQRAQQIADKDSNSQTIDISEAQKKYVPFTDTQVMVIHEAIHDPSKTQVTINDQTYELAIGKAGCRFVRVGEVTFIEQSKEKKTKYAKMALDGKKITWICTSGQWGLIVNSEIVKKGTEQ